MAKIKKKKSSDTKSWKGCCKKGIIILYDETKNCGGNYRNQYGKHSET